MSYQFKLSHDQVNQVNISRWYLLEQVNQNPYPRPITVKAKVLSLLPIIDLSNAEPVNKNKHINDKVSHKINLRIEQIDGEQLTHPFVARVSISNVHLPMHLPLRLAMHLPLHAVGHLGSDSNATDNKRVLSQGDSVQLKLKLKPAHGFANLGSFSYVRWLKSNGIHFNGYVKPDANNQILLQQPSMRQSVQRRLQYLIQNSPVKNRSAQKAKQYLAFILALSIGDKSQLTQQHWQLLQNTGTQHLMAISGLHLSIIAGLGYLLGRLLLMLVPGAIFGRSWINAYGYLLPIAMSLILASFYAYLAGFAMPTIRALVMLWLFFMFRFLKLPFKPFRYLLSSAFVIVLIEPFAIFDISFYLSLLAVMIIIYGVYVFKHHLANRSWLLRFIASILLVQVVVSLMVLPLSLWFFNNMSLLSPIANIIVVPIMSISAIPLSLLTTISTIFLSTDYFSASFTSTGMSSQLAQDMTMLLLQLTAVSLDFCIEYLHWLDQFHIELPNMSSLFKSTCLFAALCGAFSWVLPATKKQKALFVALPTTLLLLMNLAMNVAITRISTNDQHAWRVVVFDVGHGLAVLIEKNGHAMLYDTGAKFKSGFNFIEASVMPYLQLSSILKPSILSLAQQSQLQSFPRKPHLGGRPQNLASSSPLDMVIISHSDNDHAGAINEIVKHGLSTHVISNADNVINRVRSANQAENKIHHTPCVKGQSINWQGLTIEMLWPEDIKGEENDDSCVLLIFDGKHRLLLPGDISKRVEAKLLSTLSHDIDLVIAPHHGSKSSSSLAFVEKLAPDYIVYSSGYLNRWHMPVQAVQQRYRQMGSKAFNTAEQGMLVFDINSNTNINTSINTITARSYRHDLWRPWPFN
ncbi:DNA internalization-related competence protein ComEC/Rec2 [Thalassotalea sp. HSM 43]|uniref:DNA internalization-related competence protein ComEC/Rec2 n=1 Tax=Thalassotalea sp. HSM 43 TaxID=2552945 RepID=UPI0016797229|nr:DNA internalization-related competence protein ComEC/Rec2 [Thalassotalea sp. HSM 43]